MLEHRSWILQRSNIELLRECQRLIYEQFSERLSLTQNDLIEKIFLFSLQSSNPRFNDTVKRLKHSLEQASIDTSELPGCEPPESPLPDNQRRQTMARVSRASEKVYRGRRIKVEISDAPPVDKGDTSVTPLLQGEEITDSRKKPRRIYRGREIKD